MNNRKTFFAALLLMIFFMGISCNPARRAAKQKEQIDKMCSVCVSEYLKNNPCPQLPEINLDSLCEGLGYSGEYDVIPEAPDSTTDTAKKKADSSCNHKPPKPQRILVPGPPDTRMQRMLSDSLASLRLQLANCTGKQQGIKEVYKEQGRWKWNNWSWLLVALIVLNVLGIVLLVKRKMP